MDARIETQILLEHFEQRKRDYIAQGMSESEADEAASNEVRHEIRAASRKALGRDSNVV